MKLTKSLKTGLISVSILLLLTGVYLYSTKNCSGISASQNSISCTASPQRSWFGWLLGNSHSAQFHFIDLLELLNRLNPKNTSGH